MLFGKSSYQLSVKIATCNSTKIVPLLVGHFVVSPCSILSLHVIYQFHLFSAGICFLKCACACTHEASTHEVLAVRVCLLMTHEKKIAIPAHFQPKFNSSQIYVFSCKLTRNIGLAILPVAESSGH